MRIRALTVNLALLTLAIIACRLGRLEPATQERTEATSQLSAVAISSTLVPVQPTTVATIPPTPTSEPPTSASTSPTPTLPGPTSTPTSAPRSEPTPTFPPTSTPAPIQPAPSPTPVEVLAPKLVEFDGLTYFWEWEGESVMGNENWYFDIKIFDNVSAEYPYLTLVARPGDTNYSNGVWSFGNTLNLQCGYWVVQIARLNPDGSYGGPLSPESDRLPVGLGCKDDKKPSDEDPCPGCGG